MKSSDTSQVLPSPASNAAPSEAVSEYLSSWAKAADTTDRETTRELLVPLICEISSVEGDQLIVNGDLTLQSLELVELPPGLRVCGDLDLCTALVSLPPGLVVEKDLNLSDCASLRAITDDLIVGGSIYLEECSSLVSLPRKLHVKGSLELSACSQLTALPEDLEVSGNLRTTFCVSLRSLPNKLVVGGNLDLGLCSSLTTLPSILHVGGELHLGHCYGLRALPQDLRVGGSVLLNECSELVSLPEDMSNIGGNLNVEGCEKLTRLPSSIFDWPLHSDGSLRCIYIGGTGLSEETLTWLRGVDAPTLQFHVDRQDDLSGDDDDDDDDDGLDGDESANFGEHRFESLKSALEYWMEECVIKPPPGSDVLLETLEGLAARSQNTVARFMAKLVGAKEFGFSETRGALGHRLLDALKLLSCPDCQVEVLQRMEDSLTRCNDKPVWALNQLTLLGLVAKARGNRDALRELGRRTMSLMIVHEHVAAKIKSLHWVDDVCVYLRFEIELRDALQLPVSATAMLFPNYIAVSQEELDAAKEAALSVTTEEFEAWLEGWPEWIRQTREDVAKDIVWENLPLSLPSAGPNAQPAVNAEAQRGEPAPGAQAEPGASAEPGARAPRGSAGAGAGADAPFAPGTDLSGGPMTDPVVLRGQVWSLRDVLRHWVPTGLDLHNAPLSPAHLAALARLLP